ncbi:MAG: SulP family inorganic anion transporter [Bacteroidetes bacterium]|nr:MAG: SulP family inorganic anion transporter [Bacteroidota bacterium]
MLKKFFPFLLWLPLVNRKTLYADFIAGLTGAVMVLPQGVAFAMIAGMPPEYGMYAAMVFPVITALFGSSWHTISGPATAISIVIFASISPLADPGSADFIRLVFTLTFLTGVFQLALGLARMGSLVNFISHTVVIGFTAGAALLIATSQVKHVLGIDIPRGLSFFESWKAIFTGAPATNVYVLLVALATLLSAILIKRFLPRWPHMLLAMVIGSVVSILIDGQAHGIELVGELPAHLPPFSVPDLSGDTLRMLVPSAFALGLLGLIEAVSIARSIASQTHQRIDGNQEFIGQGLANLIGSFFSSFAGSASFTRSGVNYQAGAKTPLSAIFAAVLLLLILLVVASWAAYLPIPAMGGIIMLVAYNLIDFHHIRQILKVSKSETAVLLVTFLATLLIDLEFAIYLGVIFSLIFYLQRTSKPKIVEVAPDPARQPKAFVNIARKPVDTCPQLKILRIDGSLFFGAVSHVANTLSEASEGSQKHVLIVANGINFIDIAGAELLVQEAKRWRALGGDLYLSGLKKTGRDFLQKGSYWKEIGEEHFFSSKADAIHQIYQRLDHSICASCSYRIFDECKETSNA